jgi:hydrogenase-4 component F
MALLIIIFSLVAATIICLVSKNVRSMVLASTAAFGISAASASLIADKVARHGDYAPFRFVQINSLTAIVLLLIMIVGFFSAIYAYPYLAEEANKKIIGRTRTKQLFILLNVFMLLLVMAVTASYPILSWVFLESTTLAGAFLISFYNKPSTIEAAWKYLIINSVGLLLAFFGTLLFITNLPGSVSNGFVTWSILGSFAPHFNTVITKVAFIFILIGYGTKVGLAPMHTWKPDAYSKAPAPIGAVFSGALMPVALVIILKFRVITDVAVGTSFSQHLLIAFGLLSVIVAALSFIRVVIYKRMLG